MNLRDYQLKAVDALWNEMFDHKTALCAMPTGCGKSEIMFELLRKSISKKPGLKAIILLNKIKLLQQTKKRISAFLSEDQIGVYCGSEDKYETNKPIIVASIQSIYDIKFEKLDLLIIDEVHNCDTHLGRYIDFIVSHQSLNDRMKVVGFTATPFRSSDYIYGPDKLFKRITFRRELKDMIDQGYLVPPRLKKVDHQHDLKGLRIQAGEYKASDVEKLTGDKKKAYDQVQDALRRMRGRKKVVWACSSINHCELIYRNLNDFGESACILHSKMSDEDRVFESNTFEAGPGRHLCFVSIVSEGWDYPPTDCVVLMRPIRSPVLYVQVIGRGLRTSPGKKDCLVLDYGRVIETVGPLDDPKLIPTGRRKSVIEVQMKFCPKCLEYVTKQTRVCPACEYEFTHEPKNKLEKEPEQHASLLKSKPVPVTVLIKDVSLSYYLSKNGNRCLRITYTTTDMFNPYIHEYFVWKNEVALRNAYKRLTQLGVDLKSDLEEQKAQTINKIPSSLVYLPARYPEVKLLSFT